MVKKHLSDEYIYSSDDEAEEYEFALPKDFQKVRSFDISSENLKDLKNGKEVWLFKTPKNFKFENLKTLPISLDVEKSSIIKTDDSKSFKLLEDVFQETDPFGSKNSKRNEGTCSKYRILLPGAGGQGDLIVSSVPIKRFYSISQNVKIPQINFGKVFQEREDVTKALDLRLRHFATGYNEDDFEGELKRNYDDLLDGESAEIQHSKKHKLSNQSKIMEDKKKKNKADIEENHNSGKKEKKQKKEKKDKKEKKEKKEKKSLK